MERRAVVVRGAAASPPDNAQKAAIMSHGSAPAPPCNAMARVKRGVWATARPGLPMFRRRSNLGPPVAAASDSSDPPNWVRRSTTMP
jgi:hypothetical protein